MLRSILTDKWFIGACVVLIVFVFGGIFWSHHELAPNKKAVDESAEKRRQLEAAQKEADTPKMVESANDEVVDSNAISENIEEKKPQTADQLDNTDADVPVSPFGFGPYPPLPPGWRGTPERTWNNLSANHELLKRVRIKLRWEGIDVEGAGMKYGKVYPIIKGICYVRWETENTPMGEYRYIAGTTGHPDDGARLNAIREAKLHRGEDDFLTEADIPPDIKLITYEDGGVDPYKFLGLTPP